MIAFFIFACTAPEKGGDWTPQSFEDPTIDTINWECIEDEAVWIFEVWSTGWTANAELWLLDQEQHFEEHPVLSVGASRDGTEDHLKLELDIVGDWRDAKKGKSTRWQCYEKESLSFLIEIYHPTTLAVSDCLYTGSGWGESALPSCANLFAE